MSEIVLQLIYTIESWLWMWGILRIDLTPQNTTKQAGIVSLFCCLFFLEITNKFQYIAPLIWILARCIFFAVIFNGKKIEIIIKYIHSIFFIGIFDEPIWTMLDIWRRCGNLKLEQSDIEYLAESILIFILLVLTYVSIKKRQWEHWIHSIPVQYFCLGLVFGFSASGVGAFSNMMMDEMPIRMYVFYRTISMILEEFVYISSLVIVYLADLNGRYQKESALKSELLDQSRAHFVSLEQQVRQVHRIRHDMRAHLQVLYSFFEKEDAEGGCNYLQKMDSQLVRTAGNRVSVGNDMVDAVIEGELSRLPEDVTFSCTGAIMEELQVDEFDLCTIFSNLLANAMEACERLKAHEKRITLLLKQYQGHQIIEIRNPVEWKVDVAQIGKFTTKKDSDNHGLGLLNVMDTVEKYEGTIQFEVKDGEFTVYVRL